MSKRICIMDLDGVLAEYHGFGDGEIGKPLELGIRLAERMHDEGFEIVVQSCRTSYGSGRKGEIQRQKIVKWLEAYLPFARVEINGKAHGDVYFDDRGVNVPMNWENVRNNDYVFFTGMRIAKEAEQQ